ncbi:hypothetical protein [Oscillatoria salina]|uniref:hypothetical protein n=1 Tax=Oscillatoria salina TaxID=331517 RepID=UPI0013BD3759|nr:hypothetical protein [Oscillatoria salina]MBZ8178856.1 hypothetical protein [Oscillatoria salina IIICB1]NET87826.1 hypothetical protein [Kamptonema sp. SIO1D9]
MIKSILRLMFALGGVAVTAAGAVAQESIFNPPITSDPSVLNQEGVRETPPSESNLSEERSPTSNSTENNDNRLSGLEIRISEQAEVRVRGNDLNVDSPGIVEFVNRF